LCRIQYTADQLWIPSSSSFRENKEWKNKNFEKNTRYENIAFKSENILTPQGIMKVGKGIISFSSCESTNQ
jgi:hypothetical protein